MRAAVGRSYSRKWPSTSLVFPGIDVVSGIWWCRATLNIFLKVEIIVCRSRTIEFKCENYFVQIEMVCTWIRCAQVEWVQCELNVENREIEMIENKLYLLIIRS